MAASFVPPDYNNPLAWTTHPPKRETLTASPIGMLAMIIMLLGLFSGLYYNSVGEPALGIVLILGAAACGYALIRIREYVG